MSRSLPLFLACAVVAHAQTTPSDEPVLLESVVVTASAQARSQAELTAATHLLSGSALAREKQATIGETLSGQVGLSSTYFGPGASRPIIRGLGGDRIRVLQNGVDTLDASTVSPDHAVGVEPFLVKSIEVVRGPASLLYGGSAVGGVVNVIDHRIETELPQHALSGQAETTYGTGAEDFARGAVADIALLRRDDRAVVFHLDGFQREADDVRIPGYADPSNPVDKGRIPNTAIDSDGGSAGLSYVSDALDAGVNFNGFNSLYGVPNEPDVEIDLRQRRVDFAGGLTRDFGPFTGARLKLGAADYEHRELEGGAVGTTFTNRGYDGRFDLLQGPVAGFEGSLGLQSRRSDFDVVGAEAFLPPSVTDSHAVFLFEETERGAFTWQAGLRYEHTAIDTEANASFPTAFSTARDTLGASAGAIYALTPAYDLALSLARTERAPNTQELYADGPHIGTGAFEVGDPTLDNEESLGAELALRRRAGLVTGSLNLFANRFDGYIHEVDTGLTDPVDNLPIFQFVQRDALFYGVELETLWHLHEEGDHALDLKLGGDLTRAREIGGADLPRIPPMRGLVGLAWRGGPWSAGTDLQLVARQDRTGPNETETAGYELLSAYVGYRLPLRRVTWDFFVKGTNLTDADARMHTSFLKDIAPLPGRSATLGLRASW